MANGKKAGDTYPDEVGGCWIDYSGITAVWVCARCGLQGGAFFSCIAARTDAVKHRRAEHDNATEPIDWELWRPRSAPKRQYTKHPDGPAHGTTARYYGPRRCRCDECRGAAREYARARRARLKAEAEADA